MEYEYKVIDVSDGAIGSFLLGEGRIETTTLEVYINAMASDGWKMIFMTNVMQRQLVISDRETIMITFERPVPQKQQKEKSEQAARRYLNFVKKGKIEGKDTTTSATRAAISLIKQKDRLNNIQASNEEKDKSMEIRKVADAKSRQNNTLHNDNETKVSLKSTEHVIQPKEGVKISNHFILPTKD